MDELKKSVQDLTGAVNRIYEQLKTVENRVVSLEVANRIGASGASGASVSSADETPLIGPRTEAELKEISKLPDSVKELQVFDGNPTQYVSWIHNVESILSDFKIVRGKPIYRAIMQHIRNKIRGNADTALISYNIFADDWGAIKRCLSLHYADKRDIRTLEHQLSQLSQKGLRIDEFYASVNHQFSLIINKIKTETYSSETVNALIETYRNRALDVFIRGLSGDLSRMLIIQKPKTLPEAYTACLEVQNLNFRSNTIHNPHLPNSITAPINQCFRPMNGGRPNETKPAMPAMPPKKFSHPSSSQNYRRNDNPPPRPTAPKPHEKMELGSVQSRQVDYINRPRNGNPFKRGARSEGYGPSYRKQQRLYNTEMVSEDEVYADEYQHIVQDNVEDTVEDTVNFMTGASPAFHI